MYTPVLAQNNVAESVYRFQMTMAIRGDISAQYNLGLLYETATGIEQDISQAMHWYQQAADKGHQAAIDRIVYLEIQQQGFREIHRNWLKALKKSARNNDGDALFLLAQLYSQGIGVNKSLTSSIKLLRKASAMNIPGSEAEKLRIEAQLQSLQDRYLSREDKLRLKPQAGATSAVAAHSLNKTVTPETGPVMIKNRQRVIKLHTNREPVRAAPSHQHEIETVKVPNLQTHKVKPAANNTAHTALSPTTKQPQRSTDDSHPVDTICSGRYRFSSGCM